MPYQLHCCPLLAQPIDELDDDKLLDERMEEDNTLDDDRIEEDDERTDEDGILDETTLEDTADADEPAALQIAPVTTGVSTAPLVLTCIPKDIVCPG